MSGTIHILGLILAGGVARRFGGDEVRVVDKARLTLAGRPLLAHVRERLAPQVSALALNANGDPDRYRDTGLPILADSVAGHPGPLAGVLAGLDHAGAQRGYTHVLSVPADCPFLPLDLAARLADAVAPNGAAPNVGAPNGGAPGGVACATSGGRRHPVVALWPVGLAARLRQALVREDLRKVDAFLARQPLALVDFPAQPVDPFFNVNTPADLDAAAAFLSKGLAPPMQA
ncbi:molybdenum cofactor guanylyltransferase MobA [Nitrospirillum sp. BR 11164]|uniref:molybdenum cofactor guanylyltransferase MobA n=1 Tax=Nitrospirillum sp. BR 11164 TaxID=3104324 RepID=UPI002AFF1BB6|nr:molybdenum cofactor guanylyltransferase MobA [Nitrospirillum sp. BR 11164]MEA1651941.1 molybdenum cofactor guanylyltransferase MobA [Nitrospirillum sp. BR 11164]